MTVEEDPGMYGQRCGKPDDMMAGRGSCKGGGMDSLLSVFVFLEDGMMQNMCVKCELLTL